MYKDITWSNHRQALYKPKSEWIGEIRSRIVIEIEYGFKTSTGYDLVTTDGDVLRYNTLRSAFEKVTSWQVVGRTKASVKVEKHDYARGLSLDWIKRTCVFDARIVR